jgi:hypothetical protein
MKKEEKIKSLIFFQSNSFKYFRRIGFSGEIASSVFGIIIEMRNIILAAEKEDTILLHKYMGFCAEALANYATINDVRLDEALLSLSHSDMTVMTQDLDLEYYLEQIRDDMTFVKDMAQNKKVEFVQKCWVCIFPEDYCEDFIKIDRILKTIVADNKIKYPQH